MTLSGLHNFSVESLNVFETPTTLDVYAEIDIPNLILSAGKI